MGRHAEIAAELPPEDGNAALHFDLCATLQRVSRGTATLDDVRLLCYACNVDLAEIGVEPKHTRQDAFTLLT